MSYVANLNGHISGILVHIKDCCTLVYKSICI